MEISHSFTSALTDHARLMERARQDPHITVIVPAFNECSAIAATIGEIAAHIGAMTKHWDIVVVDDGSNDGTSAVVRSLGPELRVTLIRFSRNFGKENAITAGLQFADGDVVIGIDADGQHPCELFGEMLARWREGYDMVYTIQENRAHEPRLKRWGMKLFHGILHLGGEVEIPDDAGDFRLMDRRVVDAMMSLHEHNRYMKGIYAWVGYKSIGIPYCPKPRLAGDSKFSALHLMRLAWAGITSFSSLPLRISSALGAIFALIAIGYGIFVVIDKLFFHASVPGWPTIVAGMMFFSGLLLLFMGVLGEYLAVVYREVKNRPDFIVEEFLPSRYRKHDEIR